MISVDSNVLLHALNEESEHHSRARAFMNSHARSSSFVVCELALVELYVLIRNAAVVRSPLAPGAAVAAIDALRRHPRWRCVDHDPAVMDNVWCEASQPGFARGRIFDVRLAMTLRQHGVREFATRNTKHFQGFGFERVFDPTMDG